MLRNFSLRKRNDASSLISSNSSVFENTPYSPDSTFTEYHGSPENHGKHRNYNHQSVDELPSKSHHSTPRTFSLSSSSLTPNLPGERSHIASATTRDTVVTIDVSLESRSANVSRRGSTKLDVIPIKPEKQPHAVSSRNPCTPANLRIPRDDRGSSRNPAMEMCRKSRDYLKIKLTFTPADEILALKYCKSKLTSVAELVNVITIKLHDRYKLKHEKIAVYMAFQDKSLQKVLLSGEGSSFNHCIDLLAMDYIQSKSRIYLEASPII